MRKVQQQLTMVSSLGKDNIMTKLVNDEVELSYNEVYDVYTNAELEFTEDDLNSAWELYVKWAATQGDKHE